MTSKRDSRCFVLALAPDASRSDCVHKVAVFSVVASVHKNSIIDLL